MSRVQRRALVEREAAALPVSRQCWLLAVSRASVYRRPLEVSEEDCTIMALIAGSTWPGRITVRGGWRRGWRPGPCRQPQTGPAPDAAREVGGDLPATQHEQGGSGAQDLPLPARRDLDRAGQSGVVLGRHNIRMAKGFLYLVVIMDWVSRAGLAWRLSKTLGSEFCVE